MSNAFSGIPNRAEKWAIQAVRSETERFLNLRNDHKWDAGLAWCSSWQVYGQACVKPPGGEMIEFGGLPRQFVTTHWGTVLAAVSGERQQEALENLCRAYWYPLYAYVRRRGHGAEDAKDLTQEFFARLLAKKWLEGITPEGGRFRSFLLTALTRFLANAYDREQALRRGGGTITFSLDQVDAETRYALEPVSGETPEMIFERRWALTALDRALSQLREETAKNGKVTLFDLLNPFLLREAEPGEYGKIAQQLGLSSSAIGVSVHRLRHRYRELIQEEVAMTVREPRQAEEEMCNLIAVLRR